MKPSEQRKKLHSYIADLDDKKVLAMLTLLEDEIKYQTKPAYSAKEKEEMRTREKNRTTGKSKTYSLTEARKLFRSKQSK